MESFYATQLAKAAIKNPKEYKGFLNKRGEVIASPDWINVDSKGVKVPERFKLKRSPPPFTKNGRPEVPTKVCQQCGRTMTKKLRMGYKDWEARKYCGKKCAVKARSGLNKDPLAGVNAWNKREISGMTHTRVSKRFEKGQNTITS